ncbi:MAG: nucleoside hydrolase [Actinobacteria bacterium]|nr:nucleoside hydrolase [Actinomycetota bacterium]MCL5446133.1 nucleoside hydrolase [Actinomycetota bacterium]
MSPAIPIVLDCDPGHDDALAIMLAAGDSRVRLLGITTVAGNQIVDKTTANACAVATIAGLYDVPVVRGAGRPLLRELTTAGNIHGDSGLDGPLPIVPKVHPQAGVACDFIVDQVMAAPGEVTIVATAPLTNVALALAKEPGVATYARELVIMGGAYGRGNVTPAAEFNIYVDPEAAAMVFHAPWRITMMGLDVTHQALCSEEVQAEIAAIGTATGDFCAQLLEYFRTTYRREMDMADPPVHDVCAVAYVADPSLFVTRPAKVSIETCGTYTRGMTVTEFLEREKDSYHQVGTSVRRHELFDALIRAIRALG